MTTPKQEAKQRLDAMQKEMDELRKIIEAPDKLKEIDWSKLPVDTLVYIKDCGKQYMEYANKDWVFTFCGWGDSITNYDYNVSLSKAKLIENPKFTVWEGGECPVPEGVMVEVLLRAGSKWTRPCTALIWNYEKYCARMAEIIAYRIIGVAEGYTPFFRGVEF